MSSLDKLIASLSRDLAVLEHARAIVDARRRVNARASLNGKLSQASKLRSAVASTTVSRQPKPISRASLAYLSALREGPKTSAELSSVSFPVQVLGRLTRYGFVKRYGTRNAKRFRLTPKGTRALAAAPAE